MTARLDEHRIVATASLDDRRRWEEIQFPIWSKLAANALFPKRLLRSPLQP
jgi:hypothetical protein